jgi:diadenosine tetraphosphatase ApaH/serine/threonine PP2A family protein phosphatase
LDLFAIVKEAQNIQSKILIETLDKATLLIRNENGKIGNLEINNRLVALEPVGEALVIGDLHGDIESLSLILQESRFLQKMEKANNAVIIFLGDYGDRGDKPAETYYLILKLKLDFPKQVILMRGNHEGPKDLVASPHDLPYRFQTKFGEDSMEVYEKTRILWACLYNAVFVDGRFLMVHGGVSPEIRSLNDIAQAREGNNEALLVDLLWSDPVEGMHGVSLSQRGAGKFFGRDVTEQVLDKVNAQILIRGHEASDTGYKINHSGKVLTLFSRKGPPYFNRYGAYLHVPLTQKFENAKQLTPFIHKF